MGKRMIGVLGMLLCLTMSGSVSAADSQRCTRATGRITAAYTRGDLPIAKLLVDFAIADRASLGFSAGQCEQLLALRKQIYTSCIIDQIVVARKVVTDQHDGHGALRILQRVQQMANTIDTDLYGLDELLSVVFYFSAAQNREMALSAEREGDLAYALELRLQANEFLQWAISFDRRIERLMREQALR